MSPDHAKLTEHKALRHKLKSCTVPFLYRPDLVKSRRMLYRPDVCNCTMPYVPRTVSAYAMPYGTLPTQQKCPHLH